MINIIKKKYHQALEIYYLKRSIRNVEYLIAELGATNLEYDEYDLAVQPLKEKLKRQEAQLIRLKNKIKT